MNQTDYLYSKEHEWVKVDGAVAVIGITDFAQAELGEVVFCELPEIGQSFAEGDEIGSVESVKAVASVYSPVSGEVVEVNEALEESPDLVNDSPLDGGWLLKLRLSDTGELDGLMSAEEYQKFVAEQD